MRAAPSSELRAVSQAKERKHGGMLTLRSGLEEALSYKAPVILSSNRIYQRVFAPCLLGIIQIWSSSRKTPSGRFVKKSLRICTLAFHRGFRSSQPESGVFEGHGNGVLDRRVCYCRGKVEIRQATSLYFYIMY